MRSKKSLWFAMRLFCFRYRKMLALATITLLLLLMAACTTAWIGEADQIIAAIVPAVTTILSLLAGLGTISAGDLTAFTEISNEVVNDLNNEIAPLIQEYNAAVASAKPGILEELQAAIQTVQANWAKVLATLHISDPATMAKVEAVVNAIGTELEDLVSVIPALQGKVSLEEVHIPLNAKQFRKMFNLTLKMKTGSEAVDSATAAIPEI